MYWGFHTESPINCAFALNFCRLAVFLIRKRQPGSVDTPGLAEVIKIPQGEIFVYRNGKHIAGFFDGCFAYALFGNRGEFIDVLIFNARHIYSVKYGTSVNAEKSFLFSVSCKVSDRKIKIDGKVCIIIDFCQKILSGVGITYGSVD